VVKTYNPERKEYCMFKKSFAYVYRSPEENNYELTDERSDVYALGQIYYTLLTGLVPFYDSKDWDVPLERIIKGDTPFIDERYTNRSLIEKRLVQLMYPMWERQPQNRVEIFSVIKHLEKTIHFYEQSNPNVHILDVDLTLLAEKSSGYPKLSNTTHQ
jgi:serine/threonine protein kinase